MEKVYTVMLSSVSVMPSLSLVTPSLKMTLPCVHCSVSATASPTSLQRRVMLLPRDSSSRAPLGDISTSSTGGGAGYTSKILKSYYKHVTKLNNNGGFVESALWVKLYTYVDV